MAEFGTSINKTENLVIVTSVSSLYWVLITYGIEPSRQQRFPHQLPVVFRVFSGLINGKVPEELRFRGKQERVLILFRRFLNEDAMETIRSALSASAIPGSVRRCIAGKIFGCASPQTMTMQLSIARLELRQGHVMRFKDPHHRNVVFCPPLRGTVLESGRIRLPQVTDPLELALLRELEAEELVAKSSNMDGLEKYRLLAVKPVPVWGREESNITECSICMQEFEVGAQVRKMPCKAWHIFHERCIAKWLQTKSSCPLCHYAMPQQPC